MTSTFAVRFGGEVGGEELIRVGTWWGGEMEGEGCIDEERQREDVSVT